MIKRRCLGRARVLTAELACALWRGIPRNEGTSFQRNKDAVADWLVYELAHELHLVAHYGSIMPRFAPIFR